MQQSILMPVNLRQMPVITNRPANSVLGIISKTTLNRAKRFLLIFIMLASVIGLSGCSSLVGSATQNLANSLSSAILNSDDLETVERGLPAYLLLLDGLIENDPENPDLLIAAANLNSAYASVFSDNHEHAKRLTDKSLDYANKASCQRNKVACNLTKQPFADFEAAIASFGIKNLSTLYTLGASWAGRIESHSDDWNAIANIGRVQAIMEHVIELDESHENGSAHIYLGVMATLLPPALGGKPEVGKAHFEQAIALSDGKNLMAKVNYARRYARLLFERELHDQLLNEVVTADNNVPGYTLINTLAQKQAIDLLQSADEYF